MNPRLLTALACVLLLPGGALAKTHRHHHAHHGKPGHHRTAAETAGLHIAGYLHPPGSGGGALAIEHGDGSVDLAFVGEHTNVRCGPGAAGPFTDCSLRNLIVGAPVAAAHHAVNDRGYDLWTSVDVITAEPLVDPQETPPAPAPPEPPSSPPAPEQHAAPQAQAVVDAYDPGTRMLALHRLNNDEKPAGHVAADASVTCVYVKGGKVDHTTMCGTDALTPGTQIAGYSLSVVDGAPTFTKLYLLIDEGS